MKEIQAWQTSDEEVFFNMKEASKHEDILRQNSVREKLTELFSRWDEQKLSQEQKRDSLAVHVLNNVIEFATAISPLISKPSRHSPKMRDE